MIQKLKNYFWHWPKAVAANLIYGFPARKLKIVGVTGTKGKTSTCYYIHHLLISSGIKAVLITSIGAKFGNKEIDTGLHVTNPDPFSLQKILHKAVKEKYSYIVLEVTSNGLEQFRNWGINFRIGVITNIHADHLDYHKTMQKYVQAKSRLLLNSNHAVLNKQNYYFEQLNAICENYNIPVTSYGENNSSFKKLNVDAAITVILLLGIKPKIFPEKLASLKIPGRMEMVYNKSFKIFIDFAHTPESLTAALKYLRSGISDGGRLIAVFGCAGERDHGRRKMGEIAAKLADFFIITAEDPRSESVENISNEIANYAIASGALEGSHPSMGRVGFLKIPDRQKAINFAVSHAKSGDVVGLFGKGHEKSMGFGKIEKPWSEHLAVKKALKNK